MAQRTLEVVVRAKQLQQCLIVAANAGNEEGGGDEVVGLVLQFIEILQRVHKTGVEVEGVEVDVGSLQGILQRMYAERRSVGSLVHDVARLVVLKVVMWHVAAAVVRKYEDVLLGGVFLHGPVDEVGERVGVGVVALHWTIYLVVGKRLYNVLSLLEGEAVGLALVVGKRLLSRLDRRVGEGVLRIDGVGKSRRELVAYHNIALVGKVAVGLNHVVDVACHDVAVEHAASVIGAASHAVEQQGVFGLFLFRRGYGCVRRVVTHCT